jgi:hypothetical protein
MASPFQPEDVLSSSIDGPHRIESRVTLLIESLGRFGRSEELRRIQEFLNRTLQTLDAPE